MPGIAEPPDKAGKPLLVLLHALGGSARSWNPLIDRLGTDFSRLALDLPGFGDASGADRLTVEQVLDWLVAQVQGRSPDAWLLVGHSMGAKFATLLTARLERRGEGVVPPAGVVLVAGSPPSPEPMDDERRAEMIGWWANGTIAGKDAERFVDANTAGKLPDSLREAAAADVRRTNRTAWLGWLERSSLEDWSGTVGTLRTPALILAGAEDADLGEANQRKLNLPHYPNGEIAVVEGAAHLIPQEQPEALARLLTDFWRKVRRAQSAIPPAYARLIASDRVGAKTHTALLQRLEEPPRTPQVLSANQRKLLDALLARVLPQRGALLDLAARIDAELARKQGDGWRFAELPEDAEAWKRGLDTLGALAGDFAVLPPHAKDVWIERMIAGDAGIEGDPRRLSPAQMRQWFEEVRGEAVRTWLSHPAALARIGYDGFANGGDGLRLQGFLRTRADERESWQEDWQQLSREITP